MIWKIKKSKSKISKLEPNSEARENDMGRNNLGIRDMKQEDARRDMICEGAGNKPGRAGKEKRREDVSWERYDMRYDTGRCEPGTSREER